MTNKKTHKGILLIFTSRLLLISFFLLCIFNNVKSQDTITVMHYNLLYYGINTDFCTSTNNEITLKEQNFKKIIKYVNPTVITVNEMDASTTTANRFLTNVLNTDGISYYQRAGFFNASGSYTINMLYFDSRKVAYVSHNTLSSYLSDIDLYKLYHKSPNLSVTHDTAFFYCAVAHLKAGSTQSDLDARKSQTQYAMATLNSLGIVSNLMFMGDLNTKTSDEDCFQNLITHSNSNIRFYDPVNKLGDWYNNSTYKLYHTQSTNVNSNDCLAGGGLDDRFDFILINSAIQNNTLKVKYINNSYKALGQDGNRFNGSITSPTNSSVPSTVSNALLTASDHLPVILKLLVDQQPAETENLAASSDYFINYTFSNNIITLNVSAPQNDMLQFNVFNITGQQLYASARAIENGANTITLNDMPIGKGLNFIQISNKEKTFNTTIKVVNL